MNEQCKEGESVSFIKLECLVKDCSIFMFIERSMYDIEHLMYYYPMVLGFPECLIKPNV
jgi:hypothetical protein